MEVRAASRRSETRFDWDDPGTWADAVRGATAVYLIAPDEVEPIAPFVTQAVAAGVGKFVVLSGRSAEEVFDERFGLSMLEAERAVQASGAAWSIIRANNFAQNFDEDLWHAPILAGRLALPTAGIGEPFTDVEDLAEVAAVLLTEDGFDGRIYDVSGPEPLTYADAVAQISAAAGRPIEYADISPASYAADLRAEGYPEEVVVALDRLFELIRDGLTEKPMDGVREVLGREATPFAAYVERVWRHTAQSSAV